MNKKLFIACLFILPALAQGEGNSVTEEITTLIDTATSKAEYQINKQIQSQISGGVGQVQGDVIEDIESRTINSWGEDQNDKQNTINDATDEAINGKNSVRGAGHNVIDDPTIPQCFSSHATADVEGKGTVTMEHIKVGDRVLTSSGDYSTIYSIDHRHLTKSANFIQIHAMALLSPLELTPKHMLFVEGNSYPVPAASVKVGDQVQTLQGPAQVTKVEKVTRTGVFSPLTVDGTIVASGIIASSYSAFLSNNEWIEVAGMKIMSHQSFYNMALKPYRYICTGLSSELCKTSNEKIALSQFANDLYDHSKQYSELYQTTLLSLVVLCVLAYNFVLSPYTLMLAVPVIGKYFITQLSKKSKSLC